MLNPTFINILNFFYPVGNTPAVSLTQSLPPEDGDATADVLLLGCGDARHILFTCHLDDRPMDFTCCDLQGAVIARNVLLLSFLIDGVKNEAALWSIYYHMYLDKESKDLLAVQAKKLLLISETMEIWQQSKYGSQLKFCDEATLRDTRQMWRLYTSMDKTVLKRRLRNVVDKAKNMKDAKGYGGRSMLITGFRSAIPAHLQALHDLDTLHRHFWKYGTTDLNKKTIAQAGQPNPTFLTLNDEATLHYGTDPLLGFHLATAYAPLEPGSSLRPPAGSQLEKIVSVARMEFQQWVSSFRNHRGTITVRFFTGDALAFAHSLQYSRVSENSKAQHYRDRYHLEPLTLHPSEYSASGRAPRSFDVIDTSNLCDHVGALNLLTAVTPLLRNNLSSALYTEVMPVQKESRKDILDGMLCGDVPTLSTLLGLVPVEHWSGTTSVSSGDEEMMDLAISGDILRAARDPSRKATQMFLRVLWRRPVCPSKSPRCTSDCSLNPIRFDDEGLARVLFSVYEKMFESEDDAKRRSNMSSMPGLQKEMKPPMYHRASFAALLHLFKTRVGCDWAKLMSLFISMVVDRPNAPMGMNHLQELMAHLHLLAVYTDDAIEFHYNSAIEDGDMGPRSPIAVMTSMLFPGDFRNAVPSLPSPAQPPGIRSVREWNDIPPFVCVTMRVPRKKLAVFTDMPQHRLGTPPVQCALRGGPLSKYGGWQNIFTACQLSFGTISTSGIRNTGSFKVHIAEDPRAWDGKSDLFVTFYAPSYFVLREPLHTLVTFGLWSTISTTMTFVSKLGLSLEVHIAGSQSSDEVFITQYPPNLEGAFQVPGFTPDQMTVPETLNGVDATTSLLATVDERDRRIVTITGRLDITSEAYGSKLRDGCQPKTTAISPCNVKVTLDGLAPLSVFFPSPILGSNLKTRIARKSSYIEVLAKLARVSDAVNFPDAALMYPVFLASRKDAPPGIVLWSTARVNLSCQPLLDISNPSKLPWLNTHMSLIFSSRERFLREHKWAPRLSPAEAMRLDLKESLFSMMVQFAGTQSQAPGGVRPRVFGLRSRPDSLSSTAKGIDGVHILLFPSRLRLDLASRAVVLDCAVLTLSANVRDDAEITQLVKTIRGQPYFCHILVDDDELSLWKRVLPAWIERCRGSTGSSWGHRDGCEYFAAGRAPLTDANDDQAFLCTCGSGVFPEEFEVQNITGWKAVAKYAVRAAISPIFFAPFADHVWQPTGSGLDRGSADALAGGRGPGGCRVCGKEKCDGGAKLLRCAKCGNAEYCSQQCQKEDWKMHKVVCGK